MVIESACRSATELLADLAAGRLSSLALVEELIGRISSRDGALNAVVARRFAAARAEAAAADAAREGGTLLGPLHGLPVTIKDSLELAGLPTVCGSPALRNHVPQQDALAVQRLRAAGAIVLGKTNVPLFASDFQTFNEVYGVTRNPWALDRTPGGSSGGAAAALAAGFGAAEIGSDVAGSLRLPAHFCGVSALKPSRGLIPQAGSLLGPRPVRRSRDLSVLGPMARSAADLELLLGVLAGPEPAAARAWSLALPPAPRPAGQLSVAVWFDEPFCPLDGGVRAVLDEALAALADCGLQISVATPAGFSAEGFFATHCALMYGEMAGELPDPVFDYQLRRAARPGAAGRPASGLTQRHRDWLAAREEQAGHRERFAAFFDRHDLLLCPVAPTVAPGHDHRRLDLRTQPAGTACLPVLQHMFWLMLASTAGLPAAVVPAGTDAQGMPVGMQIIGPWLGDRTVLALARWIEQQLGGFRPPPWGPAGFRAGAGQEPGAAEPQS